MTTIFGKGLVYLDIKNMKSIIVIDSTNKLLYHIIAGLFSFALIAVFGLLGVNFERAVAATAFILLFLTLIIGPIMRIWQPLARELPWELPWGWRGELGIWFVLLSIVHGIFAMQAKNWQISAIGIGSFLGLIALFWALVLAATSFRKAIQFLGIEQWKQLHIVGAYVIFYLLTAHIIRYTWWHPRGYAGPNWLPWLYLIMMLIVIILQLGAFVKTVIYYRRGLGGIFYKCPECGLVYKKKQWAEKCEAWCREHKSCNLEITKHAIKK